MISHDTLRGLAQIRQLLNELIDSDFVDVAREDDWIDGAVERLYTAVEEVHSRVWTEHRDAVDADPSARAESALLHPDAPGVIRSGHDGIWTWASDGHAAMRWVGEPISRFEREIPAKALAIMSAQIEAATTLMVGVPDRLTTDDAEDWLRYGDARVAIGLLDRWLPRTHDRRGCPTGGGEDPVVFHGDGWDLVVMPCRWGGA